MDPKRRRHLQYVVAGLFSVGLIGMTNRYQAYSGIDGTVGYAFVVVIVGYFFALASDRVRLPWVPIPSGRLLARVGELQRDQGPLDAPDRGATGWRDSGDFLRGVHDCGPVGAADAVGMGARRISHLYPEKARTVPSRRHSLCH